MRNFKKFIHIIAIFFLVFSIAGCNKETSEGEPEKLSYVNTEQMQGMYYPIAINEGDLLTIVNSEEAHEGAAPKVALKENGMGKIVIDGEYINFKWTLEDNVIKATTEDKEAFELGYKDNVVSMNLGDNAGTTIHFGRDGIDYGDFLREKQDAFLAYLEEHPEIKELYTTDSENEGQ